MESRTKSRMISDIRTGMMTDRIAIGHEKLTLDANSVFSLASVPANARYAFITLENGGVAATNLVRYWTDGSAPTATDGIALTDSSAFDISEYQNIVNFRIIRLTTDDHVLQVQYYN